MDGALAGTRKKLTKCQVFEGGLRSPPQFDNLILQFMDGALAQLVAHHTGSVGVRGSNPLRSINFKEIECLTAYQTNYRI